MTRTLWAKFLVLLLAVSAVALGAALILRELMIRDFRDYLEGDRENRVYWITGDAERTYEKHGGWNREALDEDAVWALMLGFQMRILDVDGRVMADTERALADLSPTMKGRGLAVVQARPKEHAEYIPYPLFLAGSQIGTLQIRRLGPREEATFIERSNRFLLLSLVAMGGLALVLSAITSRRLTRPLKHLAAAAAAISEGDLRARATIYEKDEVGSLAETFNRMAHAIQRLEELRKKLVMNLAHELRTPLGAMRAEIEGMMDGLIPSGKEELRSLHEETGRLKRMLDGVEDLAHAQASVLTLARERLLLKPLLGHMLERAGRSTRGKEVNLRLECPADLLIHADPDATRGTPVPRCASSRRCHLAAVAGATMSPLVFPTMSNSSCCSVTGTLNRASDFLNSATITPHSFSVMWRCVCDSFIPLPVYLQGPPVTSQMSAETWNLR